MSSKSELRAIARATRATLVRSDFVQRIAAFAKDLPIAQGAVIAGYYPIGDEADPRGLMGVFCASEHVVCLPVIVAKTAALIFRTFRIGDSLAVNSHGIAEPLGSASIVTPDVVLVPLLAFDAHGHRLGYGSGYYDRTLDQLRKQRTLLAIGIAYSGQEVERLPNERHDHALDLIVTENGVRSTALR